ncbi:kxDL motif-containing protein CG10681 [Eurytemora carolleeae]|uniref:kxDL motif-containing protein CG10681 n=1 Tax=Eurytemora carolleeae TaxID=1294199 RepID=UPI000C78A23A|nr:kxDL motif-containing protein CG10681 [Eurytemora carolleeae]|eukprot:XP_023335784.1 kxDL motif-containing protein CG10681-like [Eurytemora affinis]
MGDTPESEVPASWMGCSIYQNYTASEVLVQGLAGVINQKDVELIVRAQKKMLQRFEKTNEMLTNVNSLSATRLEKAQNDFKKHTQTVQEMKKDLDNIFRRIRNIKTKVAAQMPAAYTIASSQVNQVKVEEGKEEDDEYDVMIRERKLKEQGSSSQ